MILHQDQQETLYTMKSLKVALCISGLCRLPERHVVAQHNKMVAAFRPAIIFYHTWKGYQHIVPQALHEQLLLTDEPIVDYCPVTDTLPSRNKKHADYLKRKSIDSFKKHNNATKQIHAHADIVKANQQQLADVDVIIRARWDSLVSLKVNFDPWILAAAEKGPVGFMHRKADNLDTLRVSAKTDDDNDWCEYLPDIIIMHSPKHFRPDLVKQLHDQHLLRSAEWGWYQVLSQPYGDIHTSIRGGAKSSDGHGRNVILEKQNE